MNFGQSCLSSCTPTQIISLSLAINDLSSIEVLNDCSEKYDKSLLQYSYSTDGVCWSCYGKYDDILANTVELISDFYIRIKVQGSITGITVNNEQSYDYTTQIASGFSFTACDGSTTNSNIYNPYANMECAIALQQQLTETVACMFGIPCYYFKVSGVVDSADITFKEYALKSVSSVKQIKILVNDGQMPSSKPEFNDFGLDWEADWETEIAKGMFATAFGNNAQPTEGDLVYIPMMKRMWMVNESYEEKKDSLMWNASTFKVALVKYQADSSLSLNETEDLVNTIVKNKYEDLFGDDETIDSGEESDMAPPAQPSDLYPVYESDSTRKYITTEKIDFQDTSLYYKGTLVADNFYLFNDTDAKIYYQRQYCGDSGVISFIIHPNISEVQKYSGTLLEIGHIKLEYEYKTSNKLGGILSIWLNINQNVKIDLPANDYYFVYLRWSKENNLCEFSASKYKYPESVPLYKLESHHYFFDIDNPISQKISKWNKEFAISSKQDVIIHGFDGTLSNIKIFDKDNDNISEILMQYPTNKHLTINDTARPLVGLSGYAVK